jgi:flavin reductase (DIM6/NTAB) family NADH-FMN oxidoreductase RutF
MAIDSALFRQVAGSFATGVTIVTTGVDGVYHGMTASSFASLSLTPPLVLVCVDRGAKTLPIIQASGVFNVNILSADQEQISRLFATRLDPGTDGMRGQDFSPGKLGAPILEGCVAYFECRVKEQFDGGDHVIFSGEVEEGYVSSEAEPLLYFRGKYRAVAPLAEVPQNA